MQEASSDQKAWPFNANALHMMIGTTVIIFTDTTRWQLFGLSIIIVACTCQICRTLHELWSTE
jgi:hypothetical protein